MSRAHINIGTNLGHREANIDSAVSLLSERVGEVTAMSGLWNSAPWGYDSPHEFLNCGVNVTTGLPVDEIVCRLREIERLIDFEGSHRTAAGGYADRIIDLDLIALDNRVSTAAEATVPHPRMHLREFVLAPLAEVWPEWRHPLLGLTPSQMLSHLRNNSAPRFVNK